MAGTQEVDALAAQLERARMSEEAPRKQPAELSPPPAPQAQPAAAHAAEEWSPGQALEGCSKEIREEAAAKAESLGEASPTDVVEDDPEQDAEQKHDGSAAKDVDMLPAPARMDHDEDPAPLPAGYADDATEGPAASRLFCRRDVLLHRNISSLPRG